MKGKVVQMKEPSYVAVVLGEEVLVRVTDADARVVVRRIGARRSLFPPRTWVIRYRGEVELASILAALRDAGLPFGSGRQWPPCDVFEGLRERCLVSGQYKKVFWHGPGQYEVIEA